jgi:peptidoglycan/LPS O-acetylase OafA/YrhL
MHAIEYRPDIDGLRAIAVIAVLLFHVGIDWTSGGYIGVDVFFVISGFLITSLLVKDLKENRFSLTRFYQRRILRIFPALLVVVIACLAAGMVLLMPADYVKLGNSAWAAALSVSNFWFWGETGYFDGDAHLKPLLHTWTLSVEEQFYLLFPLVLMFTYKQRSMSRTVLIIAIISFALSIWATHAKPEAAYFLLPSRAWELMLGSILALGLVPTIRNAMLSNILATVGLLLILAPVYFYSAETPFPGLAALPPTLGTAMLIYAGRNKPLVSRILSHRLPVAIGLISYSLYLWHWPLIVFTHHYFPMEHTLAIKALLIAGSITIGWMSWRWIETPFRQRGMTLSIRHSLWGGAIAASVVAALGGVAVASSGFPSRLSDEAQRLALLVDKKLYFEIYDRGNCFLDYDQQANDYNKDECSHFSEKGIKSRILIYGDSFAAHLYPGLAELSKADEQVRQYTATSCRPLSMDSSRCDEIRAHFLQEVLPASDPQVVIVSALWQPFFDELGEDIFSERLEETLRALQSSRKPILLVGQSPTYNRPVPYIMAIQGSEMKVARPATMTPRVNEVLKHLAAENNIAFFDPYVRLCNGKECLVAVDQQPLHWDFGHMTLEGSRFIGNPLLEQARELIHIDRKEPLQQRQLQD